MHFGRLNHDTLWIFDEVQTFLRAGDERASAINHRTILA